MFRLYSDPVEVLRPGVAVMVMYMPVEVPWHLEMRILKGGTAPLVTRLTSSRRPNAQESTPFSLLSSWSCSSSLFHG